MEQWIGNGFALGTKSIAYQLPINADQLLIHCSKGRDYDRY